MIQANQLRPESSKPSARFKSFLRASLSVDFAFSRSGGEYDRHALVWLKIASMSKSSSFMVGWGFKNSAVVNFASSGATSQAGLKTLKTDGQMCR